MIRTHDRLGPFDSGLVLELGDQYRRRAGPAEDLLDVGAHAGPQVRNNNGNGGTLDYSPH